VRLLLFCNTKKNHATRAAVTATSLRTAQDNSSARNLKLLYAQGDIELGELTENLVENDMGFNGLAGLHGLLQLELRDLRQGEVRGRVRRERGGPERAGGLRGAFDEQHAGHEGLARKMVGKKTRAWGRAICGHGLRARRR
jgi:hypothetical protein